MTEVLPSVAYGAIGKLERAGAANRLGLVLPGDLSIERWAAIGVALGDADSSHKWWCGDWANGGEELFGEEHAQYIESTGLAPETLRQYQWICSRIPIERRKVGLSMSVHRLVADLEPDEQTKWLDACVENKWGRQALALALGKQPSGKVGVGDGSGGSAGDQLDEVARAILRDAKEHDEHHWLVPVEDIVRLRAVYGQE